MATQNQLQTCHSILKATFLSCLDILDATELEDCINSAESAAIQKNFKSEPIPLIFSDSSRRLSNKHGN